MDSDVEGEADEVELMAKPTYVKVAGWLLVLPPALACSLPFALLKANPIAAGVTAVIALAVFYGLFAVNLNLPGAQLAGGWGSLIMAILGIVFTPLVGFGLLVTASCAPIALLLLAPAESRAWYGH